MPRGYPDYFGLQIFPKWGQSQAVESAEILSTANAQINLITVIGKGVMLGGYLRGYNALADGDQSIIIIDDTSFHVATISANLRLGARTPAYDIQTLSCYIIDNYEFCFHFDRDLPFEKSIKIEFNETEGNTPFVKAGLRYMQIR